MGGGSADLIIPDSLDIARRYSDEGGKAGAPGNATW